ncbi:hypothetical protein GGI42DRAFT_212537 [Trichoderma sp. SZMC 28013]
MSTDATCELLFRETRGCKGEKPSSPLSLIPHNLCLCLASLRLNKTRQTKSWQDGMAASSQVISILRAPTSAPTQTQCEAWRANRPRQQSNWTLDRRCRRLVSATGHRPGMGMGIVTDGQTDINKQPMSTQGRAQSTT